MAHAFLSPSGAPAWLRCHAKVWREKDLPDTSSEFADEGTAAHFLRDVCLTSKCDADFHIDREIFVSEEHTGWAEDFGFLKSSGRTFVADAEMCREVQKSIDTLRATPGTLYPEQRLPVTFITGEVGAEGTTDAAVLDAKRLTIDDLKYGRGVEVDAVENEQLLIYGAAALEELDVLGEVEELAMRISQPRMNNDSEWVLPVSEVRERIKAIRSVADKIMAGPEGLTATPGDKQCRFCKIKGSCEEYRTHVLNIVTDDFVDLTKGEVAVSVIEAEKVLALAYGVKPKDVTFELQAADPSPHARDVPVFVINKPSIKPQLEAAEQRITTSDDSHLATCMDSVDLIEGFCKAVRAELERRLLAGTFTDARYKLVEGKKGHRAWIDEADAEAAMKAMRLKVDEMYDMNVISPTSAEKVLAAKSPRKWKKLQDQITQTQGKPSVAPASDKRRALDMAVTFTPILVDVENTTLEEGIEALI
jgi:hypothetical protein